ncbi:phospho-sugar mutase [Enterococcus timonensis]|uniref:phospho-sugar mutase n=1 Tax=Enterococcus timonensis TaxID=1852364 RepID=UPI0008DACA48|nr:phospho-sugar mutase [Enterococcus timonensis]
MSWEKIYQNWANFEELDSDLKAQLNNLALSQAELEDAFYAPLEFGTAGMRGIIGPGINRMNIYTVRQATEGLALLMDLQEPEIKKRGVVIAYDSRHMSPDFAMEAARTLAYHNIPSFVFESLRPTPELSFAVRHLESFAGIMITASHNPAKYNGYKVYGEDGGQMPPVHADRLTEFVRQVDNPLQIPVLREEEVKHSGLIHIIGEEVDSAYLKKIKTVTVNEKLVAEMGKDLRLVYTPLHGTGRMIGERALRQAGFEKFVLVPEQAVADPDFTTVKSPNPEDPAAFEYAMKLGEEENADLLIATDPDADRLGAAVRLPDGKYQVLTGNQIASLLVDYLLQAKQVAGTLPENAVILKSIVSSELPTAIAKSYGVETVNVLTGFKFIAEKIEEYETNGNHTFEFGFEESYGYLIKSFVRDKDAIQTLVLLAEVAAFYKKQGQTLYDGLQAIFEKFGFYQEKTTAVTLDGIKGAEQIKTLMSGLRENVPTDFAGVSVVYVEDFDTQKKIELSSHLEEPLNMPRANVLKYYLEDGTWIAVRPSGTEPKIKFYVGVVGQTFDEAIAKVAKLEADLKNLTQE